MSYRPGDTLFASFATHDASGASADADSTPTTALRRNGAMDAAVTVAVAHNDVGDYTASAAIPLTYSGGDCLELVATIIVGGVTSKAILPLGVLDRTAQTVAQVVYRSSGVHFVAASGSASFDGLSPQTAKALPSDPTPAAGETILLFSGTFAIDASVLDLSGDGVTGVHLIGAGRGASIITSMALLTGPGCIVKPGNGSQISDLTIQGLAADGGVADQYQAPLGVAASQAPFSFAAVRRVQLIGDSDGIYCKNTSAPVSLRLEDCAIQTKYDACYVQTATGGNVELHGCTIQVAGPSTCNGGSIARGIYCAGGSASMLGGTISVSNATTTTWGAGSHTWGTVELVGVLISTASSGGSVYDLAGGPAGITVCQSSYSAAKTTGTINIVNVTPTLAATQSFNNTGQTTPLPSTTAFGGTNAVTLAFTDSAGHPVSGVLFTIAGIGSAATDSTGARTVALPSGGYTVSAMPAAGLLFAPTTITVTGDATFTLVGSALSISAPADPSQTTAYLTTRTGQGAAQANVTLTFQLINPQAATDSFDQTAFAAVSDSTGLLQVTLLRNTQYQARAGHGPWVPFTTGADATFALPEVLGMFQ